MAQAFRGTVLEKPEGIFAVVPEFGATNAVGPCKAVGTPSTGDDCLVVFDEQSATAWLFSQEGVATQDELDAISSTGGGLLFEQPDEPVGALVGTVWVDTDAELARATIPTVTSLPAFPSHADEIYYSFTQSTIPADPTVLEWHLRFNSALNAWLPVGRQEPVYALRRDADSIAVSVAPAWFAINVNDPRVTTPLAGDYDVEWGVGTALAVGATVNYFCGLQVAGVNPAVNTQTIAGAETNGAAWTGMGPGNMKITNIAAGQNILQLYQVSSNITVHRGSAYIKLFPRKINAV